MAGSYTYLLASLPGLYWGLRPAFTFEKFLEACRGLIDPEEVRLLAGLKQMNLAVPRPTSGALEAWRVFELSLRNELVKLRSGRRHVDAEKYLRPDGPWDAWISQVALNAVRQPALLESEKMLDEERWQKLEELNFGHYFDSEALVIYALKLLILERWERIRQADKEKLLEEALAAAATEAQERPA